MDSSNLSDWSGTMTTFKTGDRVTYRDASTDHDYPPRVGTVVNTWTSDKSVSVQWDDAPKSSHPWYDTDALVVVDRSTPMDPAKFHVEVVKHYRLYRQGLITGDEFANVTGETLRNTMNFREGSE